ncbi:hypothetical protein RA307_09740 [Xanthobacteraceae bacterium Astr-EGSB]|uniref:hypothetical protein n=1 Tax=Astrobacterium formosum TaxID=3069710 RepID=UPI0027B41C1E|nr:hypothetical protein [Xanthobacteraceae bacterium Astr-EGSB]
MRSLIVSLAVLVAGCASVPPPQVPVAVTVQGPAFAKSRFDCGAKPVPPDPGKVDRRGGSAAAAYEDRTEVWGQRCANRLKAVGAELDAAGQVAGE